MEEMLKGLKAIADGTRLKIIKLLLQKDFCVRGLAKRLGISESAVSQHLKILRKAGLVLGEKRGYYVHYMVKRENFFKIAGFIQELVSYNNYDDE